MFSNDLEVFINRYLFINHSSLFSISSPRAAVRVSFVRAKWSEDRSHVDIIINEHGDVVQISKQHGFHATEIELFDYMITQLNDYLQRSEFGFREFKALGQSMQLSAICRYLLVHGVGLKGEVQLDNYIYVLSECIENFESWSSQTYEGNRIVFSMGFDYRAEERTGLTIKDYFKEEFLRVLTDGYNTILTCGRMGDILSLDSLNRTLVPEDLLAPIHYAATAYWAQDKRIAFVLNDQGEILVFCKQSLMFAKRRGEWGVFLHESNMESIVGYSTGFNQEAARAIYQTALDVSFMRTGGCIGFVGDDCSDLIPGGGALTLVNKKNKLFAHLSFAHTFQEIPRMLRAELVSVDGATIIYKTGQLLSIGTILNITTDGSSTSGGRTIAAKNLAMHGCGIKISNDGKIQSWEGASPIPYIEVG